MRFPRAYAGADHVAVRAGCQPVGVEAVLAEEGVRVVGSEDAAGLHVDVLGAAFHDIGKIAISESILKKRGPLTLEERALVEQHTEIGEQILAPVEFVASVRRMVRHEHERWDGGGYPDGIAAEAIPLGSRIILACDALHAMTSDLPYRKAMSTEEARAKLRRHSGEQFDPRAVDCWRSSAPSLLGHPVAFALRHPRRVLNRRRTVHESALAHSWLDGLRGVEIGGAAHNDFGLYTLNVDRYAGDDTVFKREELRVCGRTMPVDVVAPGDVLPFEDGAFDFVLASHAIEHFCDPIRALEEWRRVARRYLFLVVPHRDRTFDRDRPLTPLSELIGRHARRLRSDEDRHWSVWTLQTFEELCTYIGLPVLAALDPDDKTGNGFMVVLDAS